MLKALNGLKFLLWTIYRKLNVAREIGLFLNKLVFFNSTKNWLKQQHIDTYGALCWVGQLEITKNKKKTVMMMSDEDLLIFTLLFQLNSSHGLAWLSPWQWKNVMMLVQGSNEICHKLMSFWAKSRKNCWKLSIQSSRKPVLFANSDNLYIRLPHYLIRLPCFIWGFNIITLYKSVKIRENIIDPLFPEPCFSATI